MPDLGEVKKQEDVVAVVISDFVYNGGLSAEF